MARLKQIFSVPLNPKLEFNDFLKFISLIHKHKDLIYDIYFTCRIAPFGSDAMGDDFGQDDHMQLVNNALIVQQQTGVPVSATFNNINVSPSIENLNTFIESFKPLYDMGVHTATIPHTHWIATGLLQKAFPKLMIKNTILRNVNTPSDVVNLIKYGFNYINLDRDVMRDKNLLLELKEAKEYGENKYNTKIKFSLLGNEGCIGNCPMMDEHFEYNCLPHEVPYFHNDISKVSCPKWDKEDPAVHLKTANIPPWREDWDYFITDLGIDVFKMHGRESIPKLWDTFDLIERYSNGDRILYKDFGEYIKDEHLENNPINAWRKKITTCKFNCWDCNFCDKIIETK